MKSVEKQVKKIKRGVLQLIDLHELKSKIKKSNELQQPLVIKLGVDPTAPDIHLGHTVPLRKLKHFQELGHDVVFLIGDFTAQIGDPTGRDKTRPPLTFEKIRENAQTYLEQVAKVLDINKLRVVYNSDWLKSLNFGELVKMAASTTMAKMLEHNTFKKRLESSDSIRMHELLYPFMQGYDSVALVADVELGGSDQTFNITFARDLQRFYNQEPQICITMPILTGTDGVQKMSKSLGNYIGIDEAPATMFNKLMQMSDNNIINYMTLLTDISDLKISEYNQIMNDNPTTEMIMTIKKELAFEIIKTYHSESDASQQLSDYGKDNKSGLPHINVSNIFDTDGRINLVKLMTAEVGFKSNSEARRMIKQGAISINTIKLNGNDLNVILKHGDILKCGKTKVFRIIAEKK